MKSHSNLIHMVNVLFVSSCGSDWGPSALMSYLAIMVSLSQGESENWDSSFLVHSLPSGSLWGLVASHIPLCHDFLITSPAASNMAALVLCHVIDLEREAIRKHSYKCLSDNLRAGEGIDNFYLLFFSAFHSMALSHTQQGWHKRQCNTWLNMAVGR